MKIPQIKMITFRTVIWIISEISRKYWLTLLEPQKRRLKTNAIPTKNIRKLLPVIHIFSSTKAGRWHHIGHNHYSLMHEIADSETKEEAHPGSTTHKAECPEYRKQNDKHLEQNDRYVD